MTNGRITLDRREWEETLVRCGDAEERAYHAECERKLAIEQRDAAVEERDQALAALARIRERIGELEVTTKRERANGADGTNGHGP